MHKSPELDGRIRVRREEKRLSLVAAEIRSLFIICDSAKKHFSNRGSESEKVIIRELRRQRDAGVLDDRDYDDRRWTSVAGRAKFGVEIGLREPDEVNRGRVFHFVALGLQQINSACDESGQAR